MRKWIRIMSLHDSKNAERTIDTLQHHDGFGITLEIVDSGLVHF
jgi:hypothetical protein